MATAPGLLWQEHLRRGDHARIDGPSAWFEAAWESHRQFSGRFTTEGERDAFTLNMQYANTRLLHAGILPERFELKVKARQVAEEAAAYRASVLGTWAFHRNMIHKTTDRVELDGQTKGIGFFYTTYQTPFAAEHFGDEAGHSRKQSDSGPDPAIASELSTIFPSPLGNQRLPRICAIDPFDVIVDPNAVTLEDARWIAHRYYITAKEAQELRKVKFFDAVSETDLRFEATLPSTQMLNGAQDQHDLENAWLKARTSLAELGIEGKNIPEFERWEAWIVHDFQKKEISHIMTGVESYVRKPRPIPEWYRPYAAYRPNQTGDTVWTKPDAWMYLPAQKILNQTTHAMARYTDTLGKGGILYPEGHEDWAETVSNMQPGELIPVPEEVATFWQKVGRMAYEPGRIPEAIRDLKPELQQAIIQMSAISEAAQGALVKGVTATQTKVSAGGQSVRSQYNRKLLTAALGEVGEQTIRLMQKLFGESQAIPILGIDQAAQWGLDDETQQGEGGSFLSIGQSDIQGHFDYEVLVGDAAEQATAEDKKLALDAFQVLVPLIPPGSQGIQELGAWLANKFEIPPEVAQAVIGQQPQQAAPQGQPPGRDADRRSPEGQLNRAETPSTAAAASQAAGANVRVGA